MSNTNAGMGAAKVAKYTRHNVLSEGGQRALETYAKGVQAMLDLPADHPQNWFRHATIHLVDCAHGNWWFYVWHRAYLGYLEFTIRKLTGDESFALPFWDWTTTPFIPDSLFRGPLTPQDKSFAPYTKNLATFTSFLRPALTAYWKTLSTDQLAQLKIGNFDTIDATWNMILGYNASNKPTPILMAYANPCGGRYLTPDNPRLTGEYLDAVAPYQIDKGLEAPNFYSADGTNSFTSSKATSHCVNPTGKGFFSALESIPHSAIHFAVAGYGSIDPGPYGLMLNHLSSADPIFFLHHANMDRLWDVWTRRQIRLGLPYLPAGDDLAALSNELFLFFVNADGEYVGPTAAGNYLSPERFDYQYEPAYGEHLVENPTSMPTTVQMQPATGQVGGNQGSVSIPADALAAHLDPKSPQVLIAHITVPFPTDTAWERAFQVIVNAPAGTEVSTESPHFAGQFAFFCCMPMDGTSGIGGMGAMGGMDTMDNDATFLVPLPQKSTAFTEPGSDGTSTVTIGIDSALGPQMPTPILKALSVSLR